MYDPTVPADLPLVVEWLSFRQRPVPSTALVTRRNAREMRWIANWASIMPEDIRRAIERLEQPDCQKVLRELGVIS